MSRLRFILFLFLLLVTLVSPSSVHAAQEAAIKVYSTRDGLAGNFVTSVAFEADGGAWVGTTEGATRIADGRWISYTAAHGLGDSWVTGIAVARDGQVWLGTESGGLSVFDPKTKSFRTFNLDNSDIPSNFITALALDAQDRVWVGTLDHGVARYDPARRAWTRYELPNNFVTAAAITADGQVWVGTEGGVYRMVGDEWRADGSVGAARVKWMGALEGQWYLGTEQGLYVLRGTNWRASEGGDAITVALERARLEVGQITAFGKDEQGRYWLGTPRGLWLVHQGNAPPVSQPLPVVLVHGWTVAGDDTLETSEFHFLASYAAQDGIPMYYARGISPKNTLYQNAVVIRDEIARVKKETGASKVNLVGFSMGGMNARAYLESSLYGNDVNRVIILGTPQAGVEVWKPILVEQILTKTDEPSTIELSPEYADLVRVMRQPNPEVTYDLLIGDARGREGLEFLDDLPPGDALVSVASALGHGVIELPEERKHVNADLHDWGPEPVPLTFTSYLYPRETYERYLRNALRDPSNAPLGSEVSSVPAPRYAVNYAGNHTVVETGTLDAGTSITRTVRIDANQSARFIAYFPGGDVDFSLTAPNGKTYEPSELPRENEPGVFSLSTDLASFSGYVIENAPVGEWQLHLERTDSGTKPLKVATYVELSAPRHIAIDPIPTGPPDSMRPIRVRAPQGARITARLSIPSANPGGGFTLQELQLYDDGKHADGAANDGVYVNSFSPPRPGWYVVRVAAKGGDWERGAELLFAVNSTEAAILPPPVGTLENGQLVYQLKVKASRPGPYLVSARLQGQSIVIPVDLAAGENKVQVPFDAASLPTGQANLDVMLLDGRWAALPVEMQLFSVSIPPH